MYIYWAQNKWFLHTFLVQKNNNNAFTYKALFQNKLKLASFKSDF